MVADRGFTQGLSDNAAVNQGAGQPVAGSSCTSLSDGMRRSSIGRTCSSPGDRDEIMYVGDHRDNDLVPALKAGFRTALVRRGPRGPTKLFADTSEAAALSAPDVTLVQLPPES